MPTPDVPEPVQFDRLVRPDRVAAMQPRPTAPPAPPARPAITIEPARDTADFVPTPEPPTPTLDGLRAVATLTTDPSVQRMSIDAVVHATAEPVSGDVFRGTLGGSTSTAA